MKLATPLQTIFHVRNKDINRMGFDKRDDYQWTNDGIYVILTLPGFPAYHGIPHALSNCQTPQGFDRLIDILPEKHYFIQTKAMKVTFRIHQTRAANFIQFG